LVLCDDSFSVISCAFSVAALVRSLRMTDEGSVAKNGCGRKKPGLDFSLGGNLEEALHKSHLPANVAFPESFNLHRQIALAAHPGRVPMAEHWVVS
jgi:hypothetical protein